MRTDNNFHCLKEYMDKHRKQKDWDIHFMREARLWSGMSKCLSRKIGTVLVKDNRVIGTGYNGPPSGIPHCDHRNDKGEYVDVKYSHSPQLLSLSDVDFKPSDKCPRQRMGYKSGEGMEHCPAVHAEINPILQAARTGISTVGATLYCYCGTPCINCAKEIIQAGIERIVCLGKSGTIPYIREIDKPQLKDGDFAGKKGYNFPLSEQLFKLSGVKLDVIKESEL